jgi:hypothetical protein
MERWQVHPQEPRLGRGVRHALPVSSPAGCLRVLLHEQLGCHGVATVAVARHGPC